MSSKKKTTTEDVITWAIAAANAADDKKGKDVVVLNVGELLGITDAFVIVTGSNDRHIKAITEEVEAKVKSCGGPSPVRVEGRGSSDWILIDYVDFVVHVFSEDSRDFYDLERLWSDAPQITWMGTVDKTAESKSVEQQA